MLLPGTPSSMLVESTWAKPGSFGNSTECRKLLFTVRHGAESEQLRVSAPHRRIPCNLHYIARFTVIRLNSALMKPIQECPVVAVDAAVSAPARDEDRTGPSPPISESQ